MIEQMDGQYTVFGLCGSLRAASYNRAVLDAAGRLMPSGMVLRIGTFSQVPIYCPDEQERAWPLDVVALGYGVSENVATAQATHVVLTRQA